MKSEVLASLSGLMVTVMRGKSLMVSNKDSASIFAKNLQQFMRDISKKVSAMEKERYSILMETYLMGIFSMA
jgi:hypothetical protein